MSTNSEMIVQLAQAASDPTFSRRTRETYATFLNEAQDWLVELLECLQKVDSSLILVASTKEYNVPSAFIKFPSWYNDIKEGQISIGTNGQISITVVSMAYLNQMERGWRNASSGSPRYAYIVREGTPKIGFHPTPSASFISSYGTAVILDMVFRPALIANNTLQPFDDSTALRGLQYLMRLRSLWTINIEDKKFSEADRIEVKINTEIERARDLVESMVATPGQHGFADQFGGSAI